MHVDSSPDCRVVLRSSTWTHWSCDPSSIPNPTCRASGSLYRLDPVRTVKRLDTGYLVANGPALSFDERWLFHADSGRGCVYRFPLQSDGSLGARSVFIQFEQNWGRPDGMTVDAEDHLWVAHWGGSRVSRFTPDGTLDRAIWLPVSQVTSCVFGGPRLNRMFVTSAAIDRDDEPLSGSLFEVDPDTTGVPSRDF